MATGRYDLFAKNLIKSAREFFLQECEVTYFVFTDQAMIEEQDVKVIYQKRLGWPYDTMMRFQVYLEHKELFQDYDYLFSIDADMLFASSVGEEILGDLIGTEHPGFFGGKRGSFESRPQSTAYIGPEEESMYFAGGFYGGKKEEFLKLIATTSENIQQDLDNGIIAVWHDESHLNRYFIDHPPTVKLTPSYCYPESWKIPFVKKLLALDKDHAEVRKM
jgi:histo-blood group ABO system transferase